MLNKVGDVQIKDLQVLANVAMLLCCTYLKEDPENSEAVVSIRICSNRFSNVRKISLEVYEVHLHWISLAIDSVF